MNIFQAIILGAIQGLTEFLPISSSAHLTIIPWIFNWDIPKAFDVALHFGTLLAITIYFLKDWIQLIKGGVKYVIKKEKTVQGRMFWYIVAATIPGGTVGYLLDHYFSDTLSRPIIIALALIVMGVILYIVDKNSKNKIKYEQMTFKQAFLIGVSQALAFIPGVSRSGITITTARSMGIDRESAARYSFMLSGPIILAATIFKFKDFVFSSAFVIGVITSFIVGIFVIKFLLDYVKNKSFKVFAIYRIIFGIIIIIICIAKTMICKI